MPTTLNIPAFVSTGTGRQAPTDQTFTGPDGGTGRGIGLIGVLSETVTVAQFTDGGATAGTYQMAGSLPAGSIVLRTKVGPVVGFAGDTTAVLIVGDGSTTNRYNTGTPSVFATAAVGVDVGIVSGLALNLTAIRPTLTITSTADFTSVVTNAAGILTISIYYIQT